jgi:hypothetical protein
MREIRTSGSEGGGGRKASPYPYFSIARYAGYADTDFRALY